MSQAVDRMSFLSLLCSSREEEEECSVASSRCSIV